MCILFVCVTVSNLYNNNCLFHIFLCSHPLRKQQHFFVRSVKQKSSNHDYSLHKQRVFTHDWLNYYYSLSVLSCLFIILHKQSDERSWSRMFVFSLSQEMYRDCIVVCVFCSHCLLVRSLSYLSSFLLLMLLVYL